MSPHPEERGREKRQRRPGDPAHPRGERRAVRPRWNGRPARHGPARLGGRRGTRRCSECASHKGAAEGRAICGRRGRGWESRRGGATAPAIPPPSPPSPTRLPARPPGAARPPPVTMAPLPRRPDPVRPGERGVRSCRMVAWGRARAAPVAAGGSLAPPL